VSDESPPSIEETMQCPSCRARQEWSDECRRCKSDLRLLRQLMEVRKRHRLDALRLFGCGEYQAAFAAASRADELWRGEDTRRLLASCHLLLGDFESAVELAAAGGD
jgi:hypothetical protein